MPSSKSHSTRKLQFPEPQPNQHKLRTWFPLPFSWAGFTSTCCGQEWSETKSIYSYSSKNTSMLMTQGWFEHKYGVTWMFSCPVLWILWVSVWTFCEMGIMKMKGGNICRRPCIGLGSKQVFKRGQLLLLTSFSFPENVNREIIFKAVKLHFFLGSH